jgi:hypothetical protein
MDSGHRGNLWPLKPILTHLFNDYDYPISPSVSQIPYWISGESLYIG